VTYLLEAWRQAWNVIGLHASQSTLVTELRPTTGNWFPLLLMGGLLMLRSLAKLPVRPLSAQPASRPARPGAWLWQPDWP
jgi:hypothetical protein